MLRGVPPPFVSGYWGAHDWEQWQLAYQLYIDDRVEAALEVATEIGIGFRGEKLPFFTMLQAEAGTAAKAVQVSVADWLTLEYCPDEVEETVETISDTILAACDTVARKFEWTHRIPTVVTLLTQEIDQGHRLGYETPKVAYEKICLAGDSYQTPFFSTLVAHEYGHVIAENLSGSRIPVWLSEGAAMWGAEQLGQVMGPWRTPQELESTFRSSWSPIAGELAQREAAYQQAGWIVRFIDSVVPIGKFLAEFPKESWWHGLRDRALARERVETMVNLRLASTVDLVFEQARIQYQPLPK